MQLFPNTRVNPFSTQKHSFESGDIEVIRIENLRAEIFMFAKRPEDGQEIDVNVVGSAESIAAIEVTKDEENILRVAGRVSQAENISAEADANSKGKRQIKGAMNAMKGFSEKIASAMGSDLVRVMISVPTGSSVEVDNVEGNIVASGVSLTGEVKKEMIIISAGDLDLAVGNGASVTVVSMAGSLSLDVDGGNVYVASGDIKFADIIVNNGGEVNLEAIVNEAILKALPKGSIYISVVKKVRSRKAEDKKQIRIGNE